MKEAWYYKKKNSKVQCLLCPHNCIIDDGKYGICRVRKNVDSRLITDVYGRLVAMHLDPVEKKPLYHFHPGKNILSVGTPGCNLTCFFCQNCEISQNGISNFNQLKNVNPRELLKIAKKESNNIGIAYTYNEPTVFFEYMFDTAKLARDSGLKNVMISNGFISQEPLEDLFSVIDAFNIDLKAFDDSFYRKHTKSSIYPVKKTLQKIHSADKHLEITYLVIPGLNDNEEQFRLMIDWISDNFGKTQVLHISRYFPHYQSDIPPTPLSKMRNLWEIAREKLSYVFLGNTSITGGQDSFCHNCGTLAIKRNHYSVETLINNKGECLSCGEKIINILI
jgi:pyruvate formate lyase activating enzyme